MLGAHANLKDDCYLFWFILTLAVSAVSAHLSSCGQYPTLADHSGTVRLARPQVITGSLQYLVSPTDVAAVGIQVRN